MRIISVISACATLAGSATAFMPAPLAALSTGAPQEVRFPRGTTTVTLNGRASAAGRLYTFSARRGQRVNIRLSSRADDVSADLAQGHADIDTTNEAGVLSAQLPATGRYSVRVYRRGTGRGTSFYSMALTIR